MKPLIPLTTFNFKQVKVALLYFFPILLVLSGCCFWVSHNVQFRQYEIISKMPISDYSCLRASVSIYQYNLPVMGWCLNDLSKHLTSWFNVRICSLFRLTENLKCKSVKKFLNDFCVHFFFCSFIIINSCYWIGILFVIHIYVTYYLFIALPFYCIMIYNKVYMCKQSRSISVVMSCYFFDLD